MWTAVTIASAPRMVVRAPKGFAWPLPHVRGAPRSQEILGFTRTGACTKRFCLASATCEGGTKKSGDSWIHKDGCNKCQCSIFGTLCTEKACSGLVKPNSDTDSMNNVDGDAIVLETGDTPCTDSEGNKRMPGEDWLTPDSCNICQCLGDNAEPSCTKMGCRVRLERLRQSSGGSLGSTASSLLPSLAILVSFIIALL